jgi:hypothetical protein
MKRMSKVVPIRLFDVLLIRLDGTREKRHSVEHYLWSAEQADHRASLSVQLGRL